MQSSEAFSPVAAEATTASGPRLASIKKEREREREKEKILDHVLAQRESNTRVKLKLATRHS